MPTVNTRKIRLQRPLASRFFRVQHLPMRMTVELFRKKIGALRQDVEALRLASGADRTGDGDTRRREPISLRAHAFHVQMHTLARIEAALERMDHGDYGYCCHCGGQISLARLECDPAVAACEDCADDPRF